MNNKIIAFAQLVESDTIQDLHRAKFDCDANIANARTHIKEGNKYTKVNVGRSGRYMVENSTGEIFGIKSYGQVHRGHYYGTLDTITDYYWGHFYPIRKDGTSKTQMANGIPVITHAPKLPNMMDNLSK